MSKMTGHYKINYGVESYDIETKQLVYVYAYDIQYRTGLKARLRRMNDALKNAIGSL